MPVTLMPNPQNQITVTHAATDYIIEASNVLVRGRENGFDTGTVVLQDTKADTYANKASNGDAITLKVKDASDAAWTTLLSGIITSIDPILGGEGNLLKIECDGAGYGIGEMRCGEEYGSDSANPTLDTIKEIIEDNTNGIIDLWVNKVLGSAVDSGYSYTTQVETIVGTIGYIYSPFKPCTKTINDICDIVQAIKGTNAGPHWIVDTSNRFLLATVGNHGAPASTFWPTWWKTDRAGSTLTEGVDFTNYRFNQLAKEANYILYHGNVIKPIRLDEWTNNNSASWGVNALLAKADDAVNHKIGTHAIKCTTQNDASPPLNEGVAYYPSGMNLGLNIDAMGGDYSVPIFHAWGMIDAAMFADTDNRFRWAWFTSPTDYYVADIHTLTKPMFGAGIEWVEFTIPIGSNWNLRPSSLPDWLNQIYAFDGTPDWTNINAIGIAPLFADNGLEMWVDGMYINGTGLRAARQAAAYSATDPCKIKMITDSVAKDDTLNAATDSGLIGRATYAEYLRCSSTPTVGSFTISLAPDMLPGQLIHVHAKKKSSGTYAIDKDFRVLRFTHTISPAGYMTTVEVSDDTKNANPRPVPSQYNVLLKAVRPEAQDRQASSIKMRDIDITQPILEKSY